MEVSRHKAINGVRSSIFNVRDSHAKICHLVQTTELREAVSSSYSNVRFDGTFDRSSPYKGPPSPKVDDLWHEVTGCKLSYSLSPKPGN